MDLSLSEEQKASTELMRQILADQTDLERLKRVEDADGFDHDLWAALAEADLLGLCLPEDVGGGGFGLMELVLLLTEVGRHVAPIPFLPTVMLGAQPIAEFGSSSQREKWLSGVAGGSTVLSGAYGELGGHGTLDTRATVAGDAHALTGVKTGVPNARSAHTIVVSALLDGSPALFVIDPNSSGVTLESQDTTNLSAESLMTLDEAPAELLSADPSAVNRAVNLATIGWCAIANGVGQEALRTTAEYTTTRKQFDRPIGTFQAVGQRLGDCFQYRWAIELTMLQAATMLEAAEPCDAEVAIAKYWAAYGGNRIAHAGLHVHGGISIDRDYPIHRYFRWAKQAEYVLGGATPQLARLGALIAAE